MTNYPNQRTERIDTTITAVAVQRGDTSSTLTAAAKFVTDQNPGAHVLAIWSAKVRDDHGNPVFHVEWEDEAEEEP